MIQYGYNILTLAYHIEISNHTLYSKASQYLNYLEQKLKIKNLDNLQDLVGSIIKSIAYTQKNRSYSHTYSGFKELDILTNGLPHGDLIIIAGRPSMGKTSFAINITYNLLKYFYAKVCIFSLEMTTIQILYKLIAIGSNIPINDIQSGYINKKQWRIIQIICNELIKSNIYIHDDSSISINDIKYITHRIIKEKTDKNVIIIDYLQLIQIKDLNVENRTQELSYITRQLKILAQTLETPVIVLSQLNRSIEKRINKKPLLSDLKESGCLNYHTFVNLNNLNYVNIKSIIKNTHNNFIKSYKGIIIANKNAEIFYNYINKIYLFQKYNFKCTINDTLNLLITDNHKLFKYDSWVKQQQIQENEYVIQYSNFDQLITIVINKIYFQDYNLVYDISNSTYTNFSCNTIILHNSIEQDADIIIMLYQNNSIEEENKASKFLDIIISKNRNGPTGSFQIEFNKTTTLFQSAQNEQLADII